MSKSLLELVKSFEAAGYACVVIRTGGSQRPLEWPADRPVHPVVVRRDNVGYDFGSWAVGMELFPEALLAPFVLVVNDSMVGPFTSLEEIISDFEHTYANAWGLTSALQYIPHLQSYFLGFRDGMLADPNIRAFWRGVRQEKRKLDVVLNYEIGLSRTLFSEAYTTVARYPLEILTDRNKNPSVSGWRRLIEEGLPMVKRELVLHPELIWDGHEVPQFVRERFGVDVQDWV